MNFPTTSRESKLFDTRAIFTTINISYFNLHSGHCFALLYPICFGSGTTRVGTSGMSAGQYMSKVNDKENLTTADG